MMGSNSATGNLKHNNRRHDESKTEDDTVSTSVLTSLVHQTDATGKHTSVAAEEVQVASRPGFFARMLCCISADKEEENMYIPPSPGKFDDCLLGPQSPEHVGRHCLVLDLDETLVHSSFKPVPNPDFIIPVAMEGQVYNVYVLKRPGVDQFMKLMGQHFEICVYTASLDKYADPLLDKLDVHNVIRWRLFREHCTYYQGHYVKDLGRIGRELCRSVIVDNSPMSYLFHPQHALAISSFIDDPTDRELPLLTHTLMQMVHSRDTSEGCAQHAQQLQRQQQQEGVYYI